MSLLAKKNDVGIRRPFRTVMSDLFDTDGFFKGDFFNEPTLPAVNVKENDKSFEIELAAPGIDKKDFNVNVDNGVLTISAETKEEKEEKDDNYTRKEFNYSSFKRSFTLPESIDENKIEAKYKDGVLNLSLAKSEKAMTQPSKSIEVR